MAQTSDQSHMAGLIVEVLNLEDVESRIGRTTIRNLLGGKCDWRSRVSIGTCADPRGLGLR